ncbi:hypothetical protein [Legionella bononiensis]|uniref:23, 7 kDa protein n=1 Tax=Legionella bononiensis TaxID=2793102 RepID=A0ABS1WCH0_9GAMM|nr:hypothetical protein [Legionella bononiensis]MBL7478920.1 hypothetical protein [Legionella bononiensis]MBL7527052.1 hypothetical protein [Legionella bononiensis]MBL7562021.1 hypothetical protein [Legionella bononiensis]
MNGFLFSPALTKQEVDDKISRAINLLKNIPSKEKALFLSELKSRISDFEKELLSEQHSIYEKVQVLIQYNRFAKTLLHCLKSPENASAAIINYHRFKYYPVGIEDTMKPNPLLQNSAIATMGIGVALLAATIPAFIFNPAIGAIFLSMAITLLFPSCFYLMTPESPDTTRKKAEERTLFHLAAQLMRPDLVFTDECDIPESSSPIYAS